MRIRLDERSYLEMPFTRGILEDSFMTFCAKLVLGNTKIEMDVDHFCFDMFPERECHC
jgi:hypothetical protein